MLLDVLGNSLEQKEQFMRQAAREQEESVRLVLTLALATITCFVLASHAL